MSYFVCQNCRRRVYTQGGISRRRWCSDHCRTAGNRKGIEAGPEVAPFEPSALNIATTLRYLACDGRHAGSGEFVVREVAGRDHVMQVCANCEVPIPTMYQLWNGKVA